jgi:hypothetical protein
MPTFHDGGERSLVVPNTNQAKQEWEYPQGVLTLW